MEVSRASAYRRRLARAAARLVSARARSGSNAAGLAEASCRHRSTTSAVMDLLRRSARGRVGREQPPVDRDCLFRGSQRTHVITQVGHHRARICEGHGELRCNRVPGQPPPPRDRLRYRRQGLFTAAEVRYRGGDGLPTGSQGRSMRGLGDRRAGPVAEPVDLTLPPVDAVAGAGRVGLFQTRSRWSWVALMRLKWSTSTMMAAIGCRYRLAMRSRRSASPKKWLRLYRPVRPSIVAIRRTWLNSRAFSYAVMPCPAIAAAICTRASFITPSRPAATTRMPNGSPRSATGVAHQLRAGPGRVRLCGSGRPPQLGV
jgi:hypothetical protein